MNEGKIRIAVADDHAIVRRGVRFLLETQPNWEVCGEAANGIEAIELTEKELPDILILDISIPPSDGLQIARELRKKALDTKILVFTMHESEEIVRDLLAEGVRGYLLKSDANEFLLTAVEAIAAGHTFFSSSVADTVVSGFLNPARNEPRSAVLVGSLTQREVEITTLLAKGKSNKEVAKALFISVKTVETHRRSIMSKLECSSIVELVHFAIRKGLVEPNG